MKPQSDIEELTNRISRLEEIVRVQNCLLQDLSERIGDTFGKQAFNVKDLSIRWNCAESYVRKIVSAHKLKLLRGPNGKARSPIVVLRSSVLEYENGNTLIPLRKRKTKSLTWADSPYLPKPEFKAISGRGVCRLGDYVCESTQAN